MRLVLSLDFLLSGGLRGLNLDFVQHYRSGDDSWIAVKVSSVSNAFTNFNGACMKDAHAT